MKVILKMTKNMEMELKLLLMDGYTKDNLEIIFMKEKESIHTKITNNIIKANSKIVNFMEKADSISIKIIFFKELLNKEFLKKLV